MSVAHDPTWIKEPPYDPNTRLDARSRLERSRSSCARQPTKAYTIFSGKPKQRPPRTYRFFSNFHMSIKEVNIIVAELEGVPGKPSKDPDVVAVKWLKAHPAIVADRLKGME